MIAGHDFQAVAGAGERQTRVDRQSAESAHRVRCVVPGSTVNDVQRGDVNDDAA